MIKTLLLASAFALAAPAFAQTTTGTGKTPPTSDSAATGPTTAVTPAPAATGAPTSGATTTPPTGTTSMGSATTGSATTATTTAQAPINPADAVAQLVNTDWSKYDTNNDGVLSKEEFANWIIALRAQNPSSTNQKIDNKTYAAAAFAQADKDKSGTVTKAELQAFLHG